jgi:enolase
LVVEGAGDLIKIGSIQRGERLAKYNQLLRIAEACFAVVEGDTHGGAGWLEKDAPI